MRYRETAEELIAVEIMELEPSLWQGIDLWLAEWKDET